MDDKPGVIIGWPRTAMMKLCADQAMARSKSLTSYSPVARSLLVMDVADKCMAATNDV